jgi:hypothetical protein
VTVDPAAYTGLSLYARNADVQLFTGDDTWTKPDGALWVEVLLVGGGGGGGGGSTNTALKVSGVGGAGADGMALVVSYF